MSPWSPQNSLKGMASILMWLEAMKVPPGPFRTGWFLESVLSELMGFETLPTSVLLTMAAILLANGQSAELAKRPFCQKARNG